MSTRFENPAFPPFDSYLAFAKIQMTPHSSRTDDTFGKKS
jgi:hypothetical protein